MATPTSLPASFSAGAVLTATQMNDLRGAFRILQVVSTTKSDTFTSTGTTFTDVTGLSVTITPSSTASKIFVLAVVSGTGQAGSTNFFGRLMRGATAIGIGDAAGTRPRVTIAARDQEFPSTMPIMFLDSPATTSATTYKIQIAAQSAGTTVVINRTGSDGDNSTSPRTISTITVFEVSA